MTQTPVAARIDRLSANSALILLLWVLLGSRSSAIAAVCCGSGVSAPSLITGFEDWRIAASVSQIHSWADASTDGAVVLRAQAQAPPPSAWFLSTSLRPLERFQFGAHLSGVDTRVGELQAVGAWEVLRNPLPRGLQPKVLIWLAATGPLAPAPEQSSPGQAMVTDGHTKLQLGAQAFSTWRSLDFTAGLAGTHRFRRYINGAESAGIGTEITKAPAALAELSIGWALTPTTRLGGSLTHVRDLDGRFTQKWPVRLTASYIPSAELAWTAAFTDDSLLGPAVNTALNRTLSLLLTWRGASDEASGLEAE